MEKKIINTVLIVILILFSGPVVVDIFFRMQTNNFYKTASNVLLQANVDYVKNKDIENYELYIDFSEDRKGFDYFDVTSGELLVQDGKVAFALYNQYIKKCAFTLFKGDEITIIDSDSEICNLGHIYEKKEESKFAFRNGTIINYQGPSDVVIPKTINGEKVIRIGKEAFSNSSITSVYIPDGVEIIDKMAFKNNQITKVVIEGTVLIKEEAFMNNLIEEIDIKNAIYEKDSFKNNLLPDDLAFISNGDILVSYGGANRDSIVIPDNIKYIEATFDNLQITGSFNTGNGLLEVPSSLFENQNLETVIIGSSVKKINRNAFKNNNIIELTVDSSEEILDSAFENNKLDKVLFPKNLVRLGNKTFKNNDLYELTFESELEYIGEEAFMNNWLTKVSVKVDKIDVRAFMNNLIEEINIDCSNYGKDSFKNNLLPSSVAYISNDDILVSYGGNSQDIVVPNSISKITASFDNVRSFDFGNVTEIDDYFLDNNNLETVRLVRVVKIGTQAFANNKLKEVTLPNSVMEIGPKAFSNNPLSKINVLGKVDAREFLKLGLDWNGKGRILYEIKKDAI